MILFTEFDLTTRSVIAHRSTNDPLSVAFSIPDGRWAVIGRHVPFDEFVSDEVGFFVRGTGKVGDLSLDATQPQISGRTA